MKHHSHIYILVTKTPRLLASGSTHWPYYTRILWGFITAAPDMTRQERSLKYEASTRAKPDTPPMRTLSMFSSLPPLRAIDETLPHCIDI